MNQRKWNNNPWYSLGLALLLCAAALVTATGTALARYRAERDEILTFQVRSPAQICLGTVNVVEGEDGTTTKVFVPNGEMAWEEITQKEHYRLELAVANGVSETAFSEKKQEIHFRLITTAGIADETIISLRLPPETEEGEYTEIQAVATPIEEGTNLYMTNGYGYVYTFHEQQEGTEEPGEELTWLLPGGELSYIPLTIDMTGVLPEHTSLVQPQIIANLAE